MMRSYHSFLSFCLLVLKGMRAIHAQAEEVKFKSIPFEAGTEHLRAKPRSAMAD